MLPLHAAVSRASGSSWPAICILMGLYWLMGPAGESCPSAMIMVVGVVFSQWSVKALVESVLLTQLATTIQQSTHRRPVLLPSICDLHVHKVQVRIFWFGLGFGELGGCQRGPRGHSWALSFPDGLSSFPSSISISVILTLLLGRSLLTCPYSLHVKHSAPLMHRSCSSWDILLCWLSSSIGVSLMWVGAGERWGTAGGVPRVAGMNAGLGLEVGFGS